MGKENLAFHAHDWTVATKTYQTSPKLANFFKILATDTLNGTEFVMAVQAHKYPIYGIMNHPETQNMRVFGTDKTALQGRVNDETTDAINFYFSSFLNKSAKQNLQTHYFDDKAFGKRMEFKNVPVGFTFIYDSVALTYGFDWARMILTSVLFENQLTAT